MHPKPQHVPPQASSYTNTSPAERFHFPDNSLLPHKPRSRPKAIHRHTLSAPTPTSCAESGDVLCAPRWREAIIDAEYRLIMAGQHICTAQMETVARGTCNAVQGSEAEAIVHAILTILQVSQALGTS